MSKEVIEFWVGMSQPLLEKYVIKGTIYIDPVDQSVEKICKKCNEWWPLTNEFWYTQKDSKLKVHSWCKACYRNIRSEREGKSAKGK